MDACDAFDELQLPALEGSVTPDLRAKLEVLVEKLSTIRDLAACLRAAKGLHCLGRLAEAIAKYDEAKELAQEKLGPLVFACIHRGMLLSKLGKYSEARQELENGLTFAERFEANESNREYYQVNVLGPGQRELGIVLFFLKDYARAVEVIEQVVDHDDCCLRYYLGSSYAKLDMLEPAVDNLKLAMGLASGKDEQVVLAACKRLATIFMSDKANELYYLNAAAESADKQGAYIALSSAKRRLGALHFASGDMEEAGKCFRQAVEAALKIEQPAEVQARELHLSSFCLARHIKFHEVKNAEFVNDWDESELQQRIMQKPVEQHRAEALSILCSSAVLDRRLEDAWDLLRQGLRLAELEGTVYDLKWSQAQLYRLQNENLKELEVLHECIPIAPTEEARIKTQIAWAYSLGLAGEWRKAASELEIVMENNETLLEKNKPLKGSLLWGLGLALVPLWRLTEGIQKLEEAKKILEGGEDLASLCVTLFFAYISNQQILPALDLASTFSDLGGNWLLMNGIAASGVNDNKKALESLRGYNDLQSENMQANEKFDVLMSLGNAYKSVGDAEAALEKYDEALEAAESLVVAVRDMAKVNILLNKGALYLLRGPMYATEALEQYQQAVHGLKLVDNVNPKHFAVAYTGQALALYYTDDKSSSAKLLDEAEPLAGNDKFLTAKIKRVRAAVFRFLRNPHAVDEAREAVLLFSEIQKSLEHFEFAWITLLEGEMRHCNNFLQEILVKDEQHLEALLWAERGRMRLYFYLMQRNLRTPSSDNVYLDSDIFDKSDQVAAACIKETVARLPPKTAIVEYTYWEDVYINQADTMYIYVIRSLPELRVDVVTVRFKEFFVGKERTSMGKTIDALVSATRSSITRKSRKNDEKVKLGLGILYDLLLQPVEELLRSCDTLLFAPYGKLGEVPFAALYKKSDNKFLIESKTVGVIPSLRALRHCLDRQELLEKRCQKAAFVAGDPSPMGMKLPQLKGAAEEARQVAEMLKVDALLGPRMTKEAVIQGMTSGSSIVMVATHGLINAQFPQGALVMQHQINMDPAAIALEQPLGISRAAVSASANAAEVLSSKEIQALDVQSKLVVLSACETGKGEVFAEGLLGLGRAVLQAGAPCTVLTLWKVDDDTTKVLMTGMFEELVEGRHGVLDALRCSMLRLLNSGHYVYNWAPVFAFGSPTLKSFSTKNKDS